MKTKIATYDEMDNEVNKILGRAPKRLRFSMYETTKEPEKEDMSDWEVEYPDFNQRFTDGECVFVCNEYESNIIKNPTWKHVLKEANNAACGDHVFLEQVELDKTEDGVKFYDMWFGS